MRLRNGHAAVVLACATFYAGLLYYRSIRKLSKNIRSSDPVHSKLKAHSDMFTPPRLVQVTSNVYVAIGHGLANSIMVITDDSIIVIDTCESETSALSCLKAFRTVTDKPVACVIYTHHHSDHIGGTSVFTSSRTHIWSHSSTAQRIVEFNTTSTVSAKRAYRQFGVFLPKPMHENSGIGSSLCIGHGQGISHVLPTKTYEGRKRIKYGGVELHLIHAPGETEDHTVVWYPEEGVLFSADNFYHSFPNLYAIRGVPYRSPEDWVASLDLMRDLNPVVMVPSHTLPVFGENTVSTHLLNYRDAIQYVHDQTIRHMLRGLGPDEICELVSLPPHLAEEDYLTEYYGTVKWSIKSIFTGYLGWFDGDASTLSKLSPKDYGLRFMKLAGGEKRVLHLAREAIKDQDYQWACELATHAWYASDKKRGNFERSLAFSALGAQQVSANGRNYYLTCAMECSGDLQLDVPESDRKSAIMDTPVHALFNALRMRMLPNSSSIVMHVTFTDLDQECWRLEVRNSILEITVHWESGEVPGVAVECSSRSWKMLIFNPISAASSYMSGDFKFVSGSPTTFLTFFSLIDSSC